MPDLPKTPKLSIGLEPMTPSLPSAWSGGDQSATVDDTDENGVREMCAFADASGTVVPSEFRELYATFMARSRT